MVDLGASKATTDDDGVNRATALRKDAQFGMVIENKLLTLSGPQKRHIEIKLPEGMHYSTGDYLAM